MGGKPSGETFEFAEDKLVRHREAMIGGKGEVGQVLKRVYMVGGE